MASRAAWSRLRAILLSALLVTCFVAPMGQSAAEADPVADCNTQVGTIVAVDFGHWSGPIVRGCGVDDKSGFALLHSAGFTTAGDQHDGPAFVCRMGNAAFAGGAQYPTSAETPCVNTPPTSAYWVYWIAPAGHNTWSLNDTGAMSDVPEPGEVELWTFGGTNEAGTSGSAVPTVSPASLRAHNSPVKATRSASPRSSRSSTPRPVASTQPVATHSRKPALAHVSPARTMATPTSKSRTGSRITMSPTPTEATSAGRPTLIVDAKPAAARQTSHGSATGLIVGIVLVVVLSVGAGGATWRRRRPPQ